MRVTGRLLQVFTLTVIFISDTARAQSNAPIDLFMAIDQSGSLSEKKFGHLVDFAEALSFGVANITGFFESPVENGLRVGVVTFGCGKQTRERIEPSGEAEYLTERFQFMRDTIVTWGQTCLEGALQIVNDWKSNALQITPPTRSTVFIVLSDGKFDDFDLFQDEVSELMGDDNMTSSFSVGIGSAVREWQMISLAENNEDQYFHVDDPSSLQTLIELITSNVIDEYFLELVHTGSNTPIEDSICVGEEISAKIYGQSLQVFTNSSTLECDFVFDENRTIVKSARLQIENNENVFYCTYPDYSGITSTPTLDIFVGNDAERSGRKRVLSKQLSVNRSVCATTSKFLNGQSSTTFRSCWGVSAASIEVSGTSGAALAKNFLISSQNTGTISCRVSFESTVNQKNITLYTGATAISVDSLTTGFSCEMPEEVFLMDKTQDFIKFSVVQNTRGLGDFIIVSEDIDASVLSSSNCFAYGLKNQKDSDGSFCYGDSLFVEMSGESVSNLIAKEESGSISNLRCQFSSLEVGDSNTVEVKADGSLSCRLPFVSGLQELQDPAVQVVFDYSDGLSSDQFTAPVGRYRLNKCLSPEDPQPFVIESEDVRTLNGRFCAGDGYEIEYTGESMENFMSIVSEPSLNLRVACDFYQKNNKEILFTTEAVLLPEERKVICKAEKWDPYLEENKNYYDLVEVDLYVRQGLNKVSDLFIVEIGNGDETSLCFDNPDHQVPSGYEPSTVQQSSARLLQDDTSCYPYCCKRSNISISFSGRTVAIIGNSPNKGDSEDVLKCVYERVGGGFEEVSAIITGDEVLCEQVPGWKFDKQPGDYSSVSLQFLDEITQTRTQLQSFLYEPSTGSTTCVNVVQKEYYCLGQPVFFEAYGLTLLAIQEDSELTFNENLFKYTLNENDSKSYDLSIQIEDDFKRTISSTWTRFDERRTFDPLTIDIQVDAKEFYSTAITQLVVANEDLCLRTSRSSVDCVVLSERYNTSIYASGPAINNYPLANGSYGCKFFQKGEDPTQIQETDAGVDMDRTAVYCSASEQTQFEEYQIIFTNSSSNKKVVLKEGEINATTNEEGCTPTSPAGSNDKDPMKSLLPIILGIMCLAVLIAILILFILRKKRKDPLPAAVVYNEGDKIETFLKVSDLSEAQQKVVSDRNVSTAYYPEGLESAEKGIWIKGVVSVREFRDNEGKENSVEDLESGNVLDKASCLVYEIRPLESPFGFETFKDVIASNLRKAQTWFSVGGKVSVENETRIGEVSEILPNDCYTVNFGTEAMMCPGIQLTAVEEIPFKNGDIVVVSVEEHKTKSRGTVSEVKLLEQKCMVKLIETGETVTVAPSQVSLLQFAVGDIVQIQDTKNSSLWRRALVTAENSEIYEVLHSSETLGREGDVPILRLRFPLFSLEEKIEVLGRESRANTSDSPLVPEPNDWQPGVIKKIHEDGETYDVLLTRKDEISAVKNVFLRSQELDEVILRVRQGVPLRSKNLDAGVPDVGEGMVPKEQRFRRKKPVDYTELPNHQFDITVHSSEGLGVRFGWTADKKVIVAGFRDMPNGDWGVLEATGLVMLKDQLIRINDEEVVNYGISDITQLITKSKEKGTITLRFGRDEEYLDNVNVSQDDTITAQ